MNPPKDARSALHGGARVRARIQALAPRTLYAKLTAALLALLTLLGCGYIALTLFTTRLYLDETQQKLNLTLAANLVNKTQLIHERQVNHAALAEVFHMLMVINPSIEVYLVDTRGRILAYSAPPGKVKRTHIDLKPVARLLHDAPTLPIRGDDPRHPARTKVFSAAPIFNGDNVEGYLYVVLGGEAYDSVAQMLQGSYAMRISLGAAALALSLALVGGIVLFNVLTRRLRRLTAAVDRFKQGDFQHAAPLAPSIDTPRDEIDQLNAVFRQMSERIMEQIQRLQHIDASRRELVANVSHDLRTPLASLQGYLETLALKEATLTPSERRAFLDTAIKHAQRLNSLIAELFELATLDAHVSPLRFEAFSMAELLQDVAQKFCLEAERKGIRLTTNVPPDAPFVTADIGLIERVLENLIENAVKYTGAGGAIELALAAEGGSIVTRIEDSGCGIAAADLPHIFERFFRGDKHRTITEGAGLGLAIAKRILQLHQSDIAVESEPNAGTAFAFALPAVLRPT